MYFYVRTYLFLKAIISLMHVSSLSMPKTYQPSQKKLQKYADVLVNFALNEGKGIKKGDVVRVTAWESAKPLFLELQRAILNAGGHILARYMPDDDRSFNFSKLFYENAGPGQLSFYPTNYMEGMVRDVDHSIVIISDADTRSLKGVDPKKIMKRGEALKPISDMLTEKENRGEFTWTLALYGTPAMAAEAGLSLKEYWREIERACFLDKKDPIAEWKKTTKQIEMFRQRLNRMPITTLHVTGENVDLELSLGESRQWVAGGGRNIPSFEIFTSPDWRGTNGWIRFDQSLYCYGDIIKGIELEFQNGKVVKSTAKKNQKILREMIATEGANKVGEFSLTDKRHSRIKKFMATTLFDENVGGTYGNTHIALGRSYADAYAGDSSAMSDADWKKLGFNNSSVHTDIISTTDRTVTATLEDGSEKVIYKNGQFQV